MTAVTKEIERGGGERRDTASREHTLCFRQGLEVVSVCVRAYFTFVCGAMFVCKPENGCKMSIIGLCFSNIHTHLHMSSYSMCIEKKQRSSASRL